MHRVWHDFRRRFMVPDTDEFRVGGDALMIEVEHWAETMRPGAVRLVPCDDDHFMSSIIVLIEHGTARRHMGTSMVCIPQRGAPPCIMFLYPGSRTALVEALTEAEGASLPAREIEGRTRRTTAEAWSAEALRPGAWIPGTGEDEEDG